MTEALFRFYPSDFAELTIRVIHMDLEFDVHDDFTDVTSVFTAESLNRPLEELALNAKNLEIKSVQCAERKCSYFYDTQASLLQIKFLELVPPRSQFTIRTVTTCRPTKNILEGLYYDETPPGAPPQQITQCQQWGFQRLVPCIDDMTAKCTYTTTIIADERYTNLITNGNLTGPRRPAGPGRVRVQHENTITPMAPYLFFLGCGTYATFSRECEYPDGKHFGIELLVPPGSSPVLAGRALDILNDAILWVNIFTGPGRYDKPEVRSRIYRLVTERDLLGKTDPESPRLPEIRRELAVLSQRIVPGYEYTGAIYREIGMQNSDYGGMENVGNTTITTNRIMPSPEMTDPSFEYLTRVKVHEFYHNLNGSEVTGWSPFEIWLNEAVAVHIERQNHAFHFGEDYTRLQTVLSLLAPGSGTMALDSGAASMPIEPDGFNDPNELITDITYMKGPEFVRMIETLMGREIFMRGLDLYHRRYRHGNATRAQWIQAMEEISGQDFTGMAEVWLRQTGFPTLIMRSSFEKSRNIMVVHIRQETGAGKKPWIFPLKIALVDSAGKDILEVIHQVTAEEEMIEIPTPEEPAFLSINRGYSFYGRVEHEITTDTLYLQVTKDRDIVNRFIAFMTIMDREKMRLLLDPKAEPDKRCIDLFVNLLSDSDLMISCGVQFLTIFESVPDKQYAHRYQTLFEVRERIFRAIATRHKAALLEIYNTWNLPASDKGWTLKEEISAIKSRQVKNTALAILSRLDTPDIHTLIREQFELSTNATDRLTAFSLYIESSAEDRFKLFELFEQEAGKNLVSWENFLTIIATSSTREILDLMARVEKSEAFRIEQANDQKALFVKFAHNRKKSLQTEEGRNYLLKTLLRLAHINENSTVKMLRVFGEIDCMETPYHAPLVKILVELLKSLDQNTTPSVYNTARRILLGNPDAIKNYEREYGRITILN